MIKYVFLFFLTIIIAAIFFGISIILKEPISYNRIENINFNDYLRFSIAKNLNDKNEIEKISIKNNKFIKKDLMIFGINNLDIDFSFSQLDKNLKNKGCLEALVEILGELNNKVINGIVVNSENNYKSILNSVDFEENNEFCLILKNASSDDFLNFPYFNSVLSNKIELIVKKIYFINELNKIGSNADFEKLLKLIEFVKIDESFKDSFYKLKNYYKQNCTNNNCNNLFDLLLAHFYHAFGFYEKSIYYYNSFIKRKTFSFILDQKKDEFLMDAYIQKIRINLDLDEIKLAELDLIDLIEIGYTNIVIPDFISKIWIDRSINLDIALRVLELYSDLYKDDVKIIYSLALIYFNFGDLYKSKDLIYKCFEIEPFNHNFYEKLGDIFFEINENNEALIFWNKALIFNSSEIDNKNILNKIKNAEKKI